MKYALTYDKNIYDITPKEGITPWQNKIYYKLDKDLVCKCYYSHGEIAHPDYKYLGAVEKESDDIEELLDLVMEVERIRHTTLINIGGIQRELENYCCLEEGTYGLLMTGKGLKIVARKCDDKWSLVNNEENYYEIH